MKAFIFAAIAGVALATTGAVSAHAAQDFATKLFSELALNGG